MVQYKAPRQRQRVDGADDAATPGGTGRAGDATAAHAPILFVRELRNATASSCTMYFFIASS
jgi:hypothetical protein